MAGVEAQTVQRILEGFGAVFHEKDDTNLYVDGEEAMEMANLMIVMQTTLHNPNIKSKLPPSLFVL